MTVYCNLLQDKCWTWERKNNVTVAQTQRGVNCRQPEAFYPRHLIRLCVYYKLFSNRLHQISSSQHVFLYSPVLQRWSFKERIYVFYKCVGRGHWGLKLFQSDIHLRKKQLWHCLCLGTEWTHLSEWFQTVPVTQWRVLPLTRFEDAKRRWSSGRMWVIMPIARSAWNLKV